MPDAGEPAGVVVPPALDHLRDKPDGAAWLADLPRLVESARRRWSLRLGDPFRSGQAGWTAPARTADGDDVVLKIVFPHDEAQGEAAALHHWASRGAVRLLASDATDWALLLDRVHPGTTLADDVRTSDATRLHAGAVVIRDLHAQAAPPSGYPALADVTATWADQVEDRHARHAHWFDPDPMLVREGVRLLRDLVTDDVRQVLLHGDANPGNMLLDTAAGGREWRAIDPKPMIGDPAYDPWPLLEQIGKPFAAGDPAGELAQRARLVGGAAGIPAGRITAWSLARSIESVWWQVDRVPAAERAARVPDLQRQVAEARVWAGASRAAEAH
ncbi:aminoglycoside phosphotransferase [Beutenbergia cavernae DSM 12333]|uniref:Aminoglycoside phosphotransferase n=1 Tax=Beutenbergia cavernae (strain ATCC BAA-8 / DSM 12333 / CCUG 43141 / JCM 11478 / NBRC 16432 / NCIMB 13614 / HKI 0122) TaxID=471853 RepID=C5BVE9_BEUC1|nr:aminoglycoside phosphotransferase family protein [Beutenbergia cavernae]ACQ80536.1 aminoglycoside phosphotransferase [Beutenbergia cavernae DSM 12333]